MDLFTKVVFGGVRKAASSFKPTTTEGIPLPSTESRPDFPVERIDFVGGGLEIPGMDDDVPMRPWAARAMMKLNNRFAPFHDERESWRDAAECRAFLDATFGPMLPAPSVVWDNPSSDTALERWALQGFASHRLQRGSSIANTPVSAHDDLVLPFDFMRTYDVRKGLARYGGDAWFSREGKLKSIVVDGSFIRPTDGRAWEAAKFNLRSASLVWTTLADHVGKCHYGVANAVLLATKRRLSRQHALRAFIAPFHFRTAAINNGASQSLVPWGALLHRTSGFEWEAMLRIYKDAPSEYRFETFPQELRRRGVHPESLAVEYPYATDGLLYWDCIVAFLREAFAASDGLKQVLHAQRDETVRWWEDLRAHLVGGLPELSEETLIDFLAHTIFSVTAFHNHVGTVTDFVMDPTFTAGKVWPGATIADKQSTTHLCVVASITGFEMPGLMGDFSHLMPDGGARQAVNMWHTRLRQVEEEIAGRNAQRQQPLLTFLPSRMAISVAI